jgi:DNA polymerase elongation subunit (family B)
MGRKVTIGARPQRVLGFDIEARPLGWYGGDWVHKETTAIAWAWADDPEGTVEVHMLNRRAGSGKAMLKAFYKAYQAADVVTGHYIRGFDLPVLQWSYAEYELPLLGSILTHDTKGDLLKMQGLSKSQENLGSFVGTPAPKVAMNMDNWREANRLTPKGLKLVEERVVGDVIQQLQMRSELMRRGLLGPPKMWTPGESIRAGTYTP